jgi:hypothetical protein
MDAIQRRIGGPWGPCTRNSIRGVHLRWDSQWCLSSCAQRPNTNTDPNGNGNGHSDGYGYGYSYSYGCTDAYSNTNTSTRQLSGHIGSAQRRHDGDA